MTLSHDQTADVDKERRRVEGAGVSVQWRIDSWRIGEAGIQVTRFCQTLCCLTISQLGMKCSLECCWPCSQRLCLSLHTSIPNLSKARPHLPILPLCYLVTHPYSFASALCFVEHLNVLW